MDELDSIEIIVGKRNYIVETSGDRLIRIYWILDEGKKWKKIELELNLSDDFGVKDLESNPKDLFNALLEYHPDVRDDKVRYNSEEEEFMFALLSMDQKPCPFETKENLCFADGKDCCSYKRKFVIFGGTCLKYETDLHLMDKLYGRD